MSVFICPPADDVPWPTLGPQVCRFIEENLCHGPGDLLGEPIVLSEEWRAFIYRMYEVEPRYVVTRKGRGTSRSTNPRAGRRRFQRCALSLRKGSAKTELAALIAACELHDEAPVRCVDWNDEAPVGAGVRDPYIPMISYSEEQTEELAYGALRRILEKSRLASDFDIGLERIVRLNGDGKAEAVSASPNARDGARTTFQHADETHRFVLDGLKRAWTVMRANLSKRSLADPWALETTTAPEPGAGSVAEETMEYAKKVIEQRLPARLFFFHRQASEKLDISTEDGLRQAVIEASGPYVAEWTDIERVVQAFQEPDADRAYLERVWTNRLVQGAGRAFDIDRFRELRRVGYLPEPGAAIAIGFDGSRFDDATGLVATEIETGFQWPLGVWEKPPTWRDWQDPETGEMHTWAVPAEAVDAAVRDAFERWWVCRMYCDPPHWDNWIAEWAGAFGDDRVSEWWTNRRRPMAYAVRSYIGAIRTGELSQSGDARLEAHVANARQMQTSLVDEAGKPLWILRKERPDSPMKIDLAMAAVLSWEARNDAVAAGEGAAPVPAVRSL